AQNVLTVGDLAAYHTSKHLGAAWFDKNGVKRGGVLSRSIVCEVDTIVNYFGKDRLLRSLTTTDLEDFKSDQLQRPVIVKIKKRDAQGHVMRDDFGEIIREERQTPRTISTVHKYLSRMRRMLALAFEHGWIERNPWRKGLINPAEEAKRQTIATQVD